MNGHLFECSLPEFLTNYGSQRGKSNVLILYMYGERGKMFVIIISSGVPHHCLKGFSAMKCLYHVCFFNRCDTCVTSSITLVWIDIEVKKQLFN